MKIVIFWLTGFFNTPPNSNNYHLKLFLLSILEHKDEELTCRWYFVFCLFIFQREITIYLLKIRCYFCSFIIHFFLYQTNMNYSFICQLAQKKPKTFDFTVEFQWYVFLLSRCHEYYVNEIRFCSFNSNESVHWL